MVDNPADNTTNTSLLEGGAIRTYCYSGSTTPTEGGFKRDYEDNIEALYIRNMGPFMGMLILGGRGGDYSTPAINVSLYMPMYTLTSYRDDRAGVFVVNPANGEPVICVAWYDWNDDPIAVCDTPNSAGPLLWNILATHILKVSTWVDSSSSGFDWLDGYANAIESEKLGFLAIDDANDRVIYCPPESYTRSGETISITGSDCKLYELDGNEIVVYTVSGSSAIQFNSYSSLEGLNDTVRGTVYYYVGGEQDRTISGGSYLVFPDYPIVLKIVNTMAEKNMLTIYDGYRDNTYTGINAFGIYYYSNWVPDNTIWYNIDEMYAEGGRIETYTFHEGETSGLRPYMVIADTDGNGLNEIVFTDEWFKAGPYYSSGTYDFSDVYWRYSWWFRVRPKHPIIGTLSLDYYGCYEETIQDFLYLKFTGPYVVNGKEVAEISVQIRYSFHDAVGADVDEVDDPKQGLWGFFVADSNGSIVTSATYIYQQLQSLEDTWPPNMNFVSEAVFLPIPNKDENYYVLYGFGDPYGYVSRSGFQDDVEFTVVVEWLGMWYLHR